MGFQAVSWQLPTSYSFGPGDNIASSSNPQRHNHRFMWIPILLYYIIRVLAVTNEEVLRHSEYKVCNQIAAHCTFFSKRRPQLPVVSE